MSKQRAMLLAVVSGVFGAWSAASNAALLSQYTFDGQNANDSMAPAANGTLIGPAATFVSNTPGGTGYAFSAGPGDNYVTTGTSGAPDSEGANAGKLDALSSFTLTTWINLQANPIDYQRIMSKQAPTTLAGFGFSFDNGTGGQDNQSASNFWLALDVYATVARVNYTGGSLNTWMFLAATYDGSSAPASNVRFYVGGIGTPVTQIGSGTINIPATTGNSVSFQLAGTAASGSDRSPEALFDDVRVYGATSGSGGVLSQAQLETVRLANVPEPAAIAGMGIAGAAFLARRRTKR